MEEHERGPFLGRHLEERRGRSGAPAPHSSAPMPLRHAVEVGQGAIQQRLSRAHVVAGPDKGKPDAVAHQHMIPLPSNSW